MKPSEHITNEFLRAYDELADAVFRYCYFKLSNREIAKDIVQETFIKTWQYIVDGKDVGNMKAFLYKVARNLVVDEYRRRKATSLDAMQDDGFDPEGDKAESLMIASEVDLILKVVDKLPGKFREVIIMRYVHDLSPREIAEILNEQENAISVRLNRAVKKAQELMQ